MGLHYFMEQTGSNQIEALFHEMKLNQQIYHFGSTTWLLYSILTLMYIATIWQVFQGIIFITFCELSSHLGKISCESLTNVAMNL